MPTDQPPPRYRLWSDRRSAWTLAIALTCSVGLTWWAGSHIHLHPTTQVTIADDGTIEVSGYDWTGVAGPASDLLLGDRRLAIEQTATGYRLVDRAAADGQVERAARELRLRYPTVDLWRLLLTELRKP